MGDIDLVNLISHLVIYMVVLLMAISCHEAGHAWMSYKYGDDTAYMLGRVTLNPVAHTDPIGTLLIPIISFVLGSFGGALASIPLIGWGKPTPVNPRKWTKYKQANVMVSIAGIAANLILATLAFVVFKTLLESETINAENAEAKNSRSCADLSSGRRRSRKINNFHTIGRARTRRTDVDIVLHFPNGRA